MASIRTGGNLLGGSLEQLLMAEEILPGDAPSYQLCKTIYAYHPLGAKIAEKPLDIAQSQKRKISVPKGPEAKVKEAFEREWKVIGADSHIFNTMRLSRVYGVASLAMLVDGLATNIPVDYKTLAKAKLAFNVFDPLNTAGSLVLNQNPNAMDFLKTSGLIRVSGVTYHPSRAVVVMNGDPIFIEYTVSSFGYVGRSVYQRALYPLKSFIASMITDDMVTVKAGVLVAKQKSPGSIIDNVMTRIFGQKREVVKEAKTYNVISIGTEEGIESLNLQNLDGAFGMARKDILENIAAACDDMPAQLLNSETFAEGFGEGSEDAKMVAHYIDRIRERMNPLYAFFDKIVQFRAWSPEFYKTVQAEFPDQYSDVPYETAFYEWVNSFAAEWPSLLTEPDSEKVKTDDVKLKAVIAAIQVLAPLLDPENRATLITWAADNINDNKMMFSQPLTLDVEGLRDYEPEAAGAGEGDGAEGEPPAAHPFAAQDSYDAKVDRAVRDLSVAVEAFVASRKKTRKPRSLAAVN